MNNGMVGEKRHKGQLGTYGSFAIILVCFWETWYVR